MDQIIKVLSAERDKSREVVEAIIDSEQNYLFTNDRNYKDNRSEIVQPPPEVHPGMNSDGSQGNPGMGGPGGPGGPGGHGMPPKRSPNAFVTELRTRIDAYFNIVLRSVKDSIPKSIGYFLVRKSQESL